MFQMNVSDFFNFLFSLLPMKVFREIYFRHGDSRKKGRTRERVETEKRFKGKDTYRYIEKRAIVSSETEVHRYRQS